MHRSANLPASPSRSDITAENICNKESLLETRAEESFLSGINFFIVLISFRDKLCEASCVLAFFVTVDVSFLFPPLCYRSVSFLLIPTLFPEAVAICISLVTRLTQVSMLHTSGLTKGPLAL